MKIKKNGKVINLTEKEIKKLSKIKIKEQGVHNIPDGGQDLGKIAHEINKAYEAGCNKVGTSRCNPESQDAWEKLVIYNVKAPQRYDFNQGMEYMKDKNGIDMTISAELLKAISQYIII